MCQTAPEESEDLDDTLYVILADLSGSTRAIYPKPRSTSLPQLQAFFLNTYHYRTMSKVEVLTVSTILGLFSLKGLYLVGYAWLFGMCESFGLRIVRAVLNWLKS